MQILLSVIHSVPYRTVHRQWKNRPGTEYHKIHLRYAQVSFGRRVTEEVLGSLNQVTWQLCSWWWPKLYPWLQGWWVGTHAAWLVEMEWLQRLLREEGERREAVERTLGELKGEVSIGMEDLSLSPSPEGESNGERNMGVWKSVCVCLWERERERC